jgi:hypothetical protein
VEISEAAAPATRVAEKARRVSMMNPLLSPDVRDVGHGLASCL